jgi:transcriptional regulator with XRE-family HTH domain
MSYQLKIDPHKQRVGRIVYAIRSELLRAFAEEHDKRGLTQAELARRLGVHRSVVTRLLNGEKTLTARRIASLIAAMDKDLFFQVVDRTDSQKPGANYPAAGTWQPPTATGTSDDFPIKKDLGVTATGVEP